MIAGAFERSTQTGKPIDPPLLLALDEAANIAPLPNLDEIASTGPGQGVQLLTVLQNLSQASDRWGKDRAETIIANHRARLFTSGIGDRATLEYLPHTLGEEEINRISTHRRGPLQPGSRTHSQRVPRARATQPRPPATSRHRAARLRPPTTRMDPPAPLVREPPAPRHRRRQPNPSPHPAGAPRARCAPRTPTSPDCSPNPAGAATNPPPCRATKPPTPPQGEAT